MDRDAVSRITPPDVGVILPTFFLVKNTTILGIVYYPQPI
jgi:hypothetical protein